MRSPLPLLLAGLLLTAPAYGAMYKWVDEEGNVTYSQTPPPGTQVEEIAPPPPPPISSEEAQQQLEKSRQVLQPGTPEERDAAATEAENERKRQELYRSNCEAAKKNLELYQRHAVIVEGGVSKTLTPAQQQQRIEESRQQIERYCQ